MTGSHTSVQVPLVDLGAQYTRIAEQIDGAINRVLRSSSFVLGADVDQFEQEFAEYCEVGRAVGLDSGISALELGMRALGIGPEDEVITPVNSFIASSSAISFTGARPVWVDVNPVTHNVDADKVDAAITNRTKAIMVVHLYGQPCDMDPILAVADDHGLPVIEDACQAHGARYKGRRVGSLGAFGAFSFYPSKNLGAYGDAGALTTNDAALADRIRMMRNYGQRAKYDHAYLAWNRRLDTLQAAVLRVKLPYLDDWNAARTRHADLYGTLLRGAGVSLPQRSPTAQHVYHLYVVESERRPALLDHLVRLGIGAGIHYPIPIHLQEAYRESGLGLGTFPVSERAAERVLSLPMYPELSDESIRKVAEGVRSFFS